MSSHSNYLGAKKCCATNLAKTVIGPQGPQGAGGPIGPYGQQGPTGTQGLRGATGPCCRGPPGFTGAQGPAGPAGPAGGAQGATGVQGSTGASQWNQMNGIGLTGGYTGIGVTGTDVLIYGNLLVTGTIDPEKIILSKSPSNLYGNCSIGINGLNTEMIASGDLSINALNNVSVGSISGNTEIKCNSTGAGGSIVLTGGTGLLSETSSGSSGQNLVITINGTQYKIALLNL